MIDIKTAARPNGGINITPLVDIVFLLLIFFLLTAFFIRPEGISVNLPKADAPPVEVTDEIVVVIMADGKIKLSGVIVSLQMLEEQVRDALAADPQRPVVVRADGKVVLETAVAAMERCKRGGAQRLIIATEEPEVP